MAPGTYWLSLSEPNAFWTGFVIGNGTVGTGCCFMTPPDSGTFMDRSSKFGVGGQGPQTITVGNGLAFELFGGDPVTSAPEPGTMGLAGAALLALIPLLRRSSR